MEYLLYETAVIIPCYNEGDRINLRLFRSFLVDNRSYIFCFVNDGSTDKTADVLYSLAGSVRNVVVLCLDKNMGKGEAIRQGMQYVLNNYNVTYIAYVDADLSTPLEEIGRLVSILKNSESLVLVFGARVLLFGKKIYRSNFRHYGGRIIATLISVVLNLPIYDTQCGIKVFKKDLAVTIFEEQFITRWLFDLEIFIRMKKSYLDRDLYLLMKEVPLNSWREVRGSKIKVIDIMKLHFLFIKIIVKYKMF